MMEMRSVTKWILVCAWFLSNQSISAQCEDCSTVVSSNGISSYTVSGGQKLCVASNFTYTGNLYLMGGTICNAGTITKIHFYSGTFDNSITGRLAATTNTDLTFSLNDKLVINGYSGSLINTSGDLIINTSGSDSIIFNIHEGASVSCNDLDLNSSRARFKIGLAATSPTTGGYTTAMNVNGNATLESHFNMLIQEGTSFNVNGSLDLLNEGLKTVNNYGIINVTGSVGIAGDGEGTSTVTINNYGEFSAFGTFSSAMSDAVVKINNYGGAAPSVLYLEASLEISESGNELINEDVLFVNDDITLLNGSVENNFHAEAKNLSIQSGTCTNNSMLFLSGDIAITGTAGVLNNHDIILSDGNLDNYGTMNQGKRAVCRVINLENYSGATISGPEDILDSEEEEDTTTYARVVVYEQSTNAGKLDGHLLFEDLSYSGVSDKRIDVIEETADIKDAVIFRRRCELAFRMGIVRTSTSAWVRTRTFYCPGESITFYFNTIYTVVSGPTWTTNIPRSGFIITNPSPPYSYVIMGVLASGNVTVTTTYNDGVGECEETLILPITVGNGSIATTSPQYFGVGNNITLTSTVTVGTPPYQYTWTPNYFFVSPYSNNSYDPVIQPQVSLIYTVNAVDGFGCTASNTVEVIGQPFAVLDKKLTGEYYKLFDDQYLFFKYDGQYDNMNLIYRVYDKTNAVVASNSSGNLVNIGTVVPGDNRFTLNASGLSTGYYVLEVVNEKKERQYLRFKK